MIPKIAIIGRPNVGKSSLLNMLARRRISIVDATPGVTRDRISAWVTLPPGEKGGRPRQVEFIDTGGHGIHDTPGLMTEVERQIALALSEAHLVLFVVDAQTGVLAPDHAVARLLRQTRGMVAASDWQGERGKTPVLVVANKADSPAQEPAAAEAARLGFGAAVVVSATTGYNKFGLLEAIGEPLERLAGQGGEVAEACGDAGTWSEEGVEAEEAIAGRDPEGGLLLAIVGKRNAGKSTLVNALAGEERVIVSEEPGTTRDSVDVRFAHGGQTFTAIDTAGARKHKSLAGDLELYSQHRALRSIRRADVVLLLIDALAPISQVDQQLAQEVLKHFKPAVLVVNKWDRVREPEKQEEFGVYLAKELKGLDFAPIVFISAKRAEGLEELLGMAGNLHQQAGHRVPTAQVNELVQKVVTARKPPAKGGRSARVYYATQFAAHPPTLGLWVNDPQLFDASYQRYLLNHLRDLLPYSEVPIKLAMRRRTREARGSKGGKTKR